MNDRRLNKEGWYFTYWQAGEKNSETFVKGPFENLYDASAARRAMLREPHDLRCDTPFLIGKK